MFNTTKHILFITETNILYCSVSLGSSPVVQEIHNTKWTRSNLDSILPELAAEINSKSIYILLGKNMSYVIRADIAADLKGTAEREAIFSIVREQIPEDLHEYDWDYKVISRDEKMKHVVAFAPVEDVFNQVSEVLVKHKIFIEAVEPEEISVSRNTNPVIGIAQKKDISGNDETTLNIEVKSVIKPLDEQPIQEITKQRKTTLRRSYAIALLLTAIAATIVIPLILFSRSKQNIMPLQSKISTPPTVVPTASTRQGLEQKSLSVLNGSGIAGEASKAAEILRTAGFREITTGNADSFDFEKSIIRMKPGSGSAELAEKVRLLLSENYESTIEGELTPNENYDLLIIVGQPK